jgi:hypothetical protein
MLSTQIKRTLTTSAASLGFFSNDRWPESFTRQIMGPGEFVQLNAHLVFESGEGWTMEDAEYWNETSGIRLFVERW